VDEWILLQTKSLRWDGGFLTLVECLGEGMIGEGDSGGDVSNRGMSSTMIGGQVLISGVEGWESERTLTDEK